MTDRATQQPAPRRDHGFPKGEAAPGEAVVVQIEASSFDPARADLRAIAGVRIRGQRILTSGLLSIRLNPGDPVEPALDRLLELIDGCTVVGYFLDFTLGVLDRHLRPMIGMELPNRRVEVSSLYYDRKSKLPSKSAVDLRLDSILRDLDLPERGADSAEANVLAAAMAYLRLRPADGR